MRAKARTLLPAVAVLALVALVAIAATGTTPAGTSAGRRPSETLLDTFFSLGLLLLLPGAVLLVYGLMQRKDIAREMASGRYPRTSIFAFLVFVGLFTGFVYLRREGFRFRLGDREVADIGAPLDGSAVPDVGAGDPDAYQVEFAWIPVLVVVGLAAAAAVAFVLARRRRSRVAGDSAELAEELAEVLDDTLDDLRAEPDARRAVIAAFARLERALAAGGAPRQRAETADEYVARVLELLDVDPGAVGQLSALFVRAKFSQHEIDEAMKNEAIDALERVRDELRNVVDALPAREDPSRPPATSGRVPAA